MSNKKIKEAIGRHAKASKRIVHFVTLVLVVLAMGVLGLFPSNSLEILSPLNGVVMWFAIACVIFCIINLFNKERVPGEIEFSNFAYINLLFTLGPIRWFFQMLGCKCTDYFNWRDLGPWFFMLKNFKKLG